VLLLSIQTRKVFVRQWAQVKHTSIQLRGSRSVVLEERNIHLDEGSPASS
jgi:hypothetical protein